MRETMPLRLVLGGGRLDRQISDAKRLLLLYRQDSGHNYLTYLPITPPARASYGAMN